MADRDVCRTWSIGKAGLGVVSRGLNGGNSLKVSEPELWSNNGATNKSIGILDGGPARRHSSGCALCCRGRHKGRQGMAAGYCVGDEQCA